MASLSIPPFFFSFPDDFRFLPKLWSWLGSYPSFKCNHTCRRSCTHRGGSTAGSWRRGEMDNETAFLAAGYSFIQRSWLQNCRIYCFWSAHPIPSANTAAHAVNQVKEMIQGLGSITKQNVWVSIPPKVTDLLIQITKWTYKHTGTTWEEAWPWPWQSDPGKSKSAVS